MKLLVRERKVARAERGVVNAAVALCDAGKGFCFKDSTKVSDVGIARRLERAVARLLEMREGK
jgi:hypothetical protein